MFCTKKINGVEIAYDESGFNEGPPIVLLTGWAHDMRLYDELRLCLSKNHWVIRVNYRGHGPSRDKIDDFGVEEQVADTLALLDLLDVDQCLLVSHSHGGWVGLELADRMGKERVRGLLMIDQIMTTPPPAFAVCLQEMQSKHTWRAARRALFDDWIAHSDIKPLNDHIRYSLSSFGFDMWSLSCSVIAKAYDNWGTPMGRMSKLKAPPLIRHIFSHPLNQPGYRELHDEFAQKNSWFSFTDLEGKSHFPSLEIPEKVAHEIEDLLSQSTW
ncbi:1H-3-hydroxy-4-oxoquinaldine 2,4-dioxygenase [Fusarium globosum]|uniref:1H-3-hydroxy-4-oxoquinaldine 2,4-dioxygenase n=1 Tax=Fusarium globosum TaxID=78864 RepID=A0A8H5Y8I2_9HYPO|nr:1H-3-hydroxy-4-oxoquinaldine 2,4-dioxygenase [Fusarium globosum]